MDPALRLIQEKLRRGDRLDAADGLAMLRTGDIWTLGELAQAERLKRHGKAAYYNINRHCNYTNLCVLSCKFCEFHRKPGQAGAYEKTVDRESAYEKLRGRAAGDGAAAPAGGAPAAAPRTLPGMPGAAAPADADAGGGMGGMVKDILFGTTGPRGGRKPGLMEAAATSAVRQIGSSVGRELIRGVLGSLLGGSRRR